MSLDTYENLKKEIIDYAQRDDLDLKIDTFIDLAENEMLANEIEPLALRENETRFTTTLSTDTRYLALPDGFQKMRRFRIELNSNDSCDLRYRTPEQLNIKGASGIPSFFTVTSEIELDIVPDTAYTVEIQYIKDFEPLSITNQTNYVLTNFPNIYLYGALYALRGFTREFGESDRYRTLFINAIRSANKKIKKGRGNIIILQ